MKNWKVSMDFQIGDLVLLIGREGQGELGEPGVVESIRPGAERSEDGPLYWIKKGDGGHKFSPVSDHGLLRLVADTPAARQASAAALAEAKAAAADRATWRHREIQWVGQRLAADEEYLQTLLLEETWLDPCEQTAEILRLHPEKHTDDECGG
jgi:hypothetical protein